jgi:hypothetical protein
MSVYFTFLLALMQTTFLSHRLERIAPFDQPLNTVATSWVVLDVEVGRQGRVESVQTLQGASPFLDIALANVYQWPFTPVAGPMPDDSHVTVVFLFRPRELFSSAPVRIQSSGRNSDRPPFPTELTDPGYPVASVGEGATVLELQIAAAGSIQRARVVSDAAGLAAHTERALHYWKFQPAMRNNTPVMGNVIVVASYVRPIIYSNLPAAGVQNYPHNPNENSGPPAPAVFRTDAAPAPRF